MSAPAKKEKDPSIYASNGKLHVGRAMKQASNSDSMPDQSWCNIPGTTFETRIGPDYAQQRKKDASKPCIYECAAVDLYHTETKISHVGRLMDLPGDHLDDSVNNGYLPPTFIVNFQMPNYPLENVVWGQCAGDGVGYSIVFYFVLSEHGRAQVARKGALESAADDADSHFHGVLNGSGTNSGTTTPRRKSNQSAFSSLFGGGGASQNSHQHHHHHASSTSSTTSSSSHHHTNSAASSPAAASSSSTSEPSIPYARDDPRCFMSKTEPCNAAVRLLHHFVEAEEGSDLRQRFKAISRMMNVDSVGLGAATKKLVNVYNSTPFLIRTCSVFWRGDKYFEVDVDVHRFSYTARMGLSGVRERIKDVIFDFGFVIEGHSDFELPENMLGAVRICKLDLSLAKPFPG